MEKFESTMIHLSKEGSHLAIKVIPKSSSNAIVGWEGDLLKIRVKATPEKGLANETLISFLSKELRVPKSRILLVKGQTSRIKHLLFVEVSPGLLLEKLAQLGFPSSEGPHQK